jgi:ketosteroid isomerase-like protein
MMTPRFALLAAPLLPCFVLALSACGAREEKLPDSAATALEQAFTKGDVQACVDVYTEDAEIIPEDGPVVRGRQALTEFFKDQVARDTSFDTDTTYSAVRGDLGVEQGTYRVRDVQRGVDVEYGEYLNIWHKVNGQWRAFRSMYNISMSQKTGISVSSDADSPANGASAPNGTPPAQSPPPK